MGATRTHRRVALAAALSLALGACGETAPAPAPAVGPDDAAAVRTAWNEYDVAFRAGDLAKVKGLVAAERAKELEGPDAEALFQTAAALRPAGAAVVSCDVSGETAKILLRAKPDGDATMTGEIALAREAGRWLVSKEAWSLRMGPGADAGPPSLPDPPPPAAVQKILDRVASADAVEGAAAWMEIGARYTGSAAFLKDLHRALRDPRAVRFAVAEETFAGGGKKIRYFTAKPAAPTTGAAPAATVGEALRYHLWQVEDASGSGFKGSFAEWWERYAKKEGIRTEGE